MTYIREIYYLIFVFNHSLIASLIRFYADKLNKSWFVRQQKLEGHTLSNFNYPV